MQMWHHTFIHNVFGNFAKETLNWLADTLYPRFLWKIIGTYDKAVEYINKSNQFGRETDMSMKPGLILNPSGEMNLETLYGKMAARFPNIAPGLTKYTFDPVYQDENVLVTVGFTRLKGDFELIAILPSFYEYFDLKILLLQMWRGVDRYIYPIWFNSFIIMPQELYNFEYDNPYTGVHYKLDWTSHGVVDKLIKTIDKNEKILPCNIQPIYKLTGITDGSTRLGGATDLPDWKLSFTVEYEVEIPSFFVLETNYLAKYVHLDVVRVGSSYTSNQGTSVPSYRESETVEIFHNFEDSTSTLHTKIINKTKMLFNTRYYHILSKSEVESKVDVPIILPEKVSIPPDDGPNFLIVNSRQGEVPYGTEGFTIENNGWNMMLKPTFLATQQENNIVELFVYVQQQPS